MNDVGCPLQSSLVCMSWYEWSMWMPLNISLWTDKFSGTIYACVIAHACTIANFRSWPTMYTCHSSLFNTFTLFLIESVWQGNIFSIFSYSVHVFVTGISFSAPNWFLRWRFVSRDPFCADVIRLQSYFDCSTMWLKNIDLCDPCARHFALKVLLPRARDSCICWTSGVGGAATIARGVDPYGTGGTCPPNIYEGGDIHGNVPPIF